MSRLDVGKEIEAKEESSRKKSTKAAVLSLVSPGTKESTASVSEEEHTLERPVAKRKCSPGRPPKEENKNDKTFTLRINSDLIDDFKIYCKLKCLDGIADGIRINMEECVNSMRKEIAEAREEISARKRK